MSISTWREDVKRMKPGSSDGTKQQDKRQQGETEAQEIPAEHQEEFLYFACDWALEQIAQAGCGVSLTSQDVEISKNGLDTFLCHVIWDDLA